MKPPLSNFIPINRRLFKHELWAEKRAYSRFEAWLDLITTARFDTTEGRMVIGSTVVRWNRGQLVASLRYLAERWGWSKTKVDNFLKMLRAEEMIKTQTAEGTASTIINICNYDTYNTEKQPEGQQQGQAEDSTRTTERQHEDKTNKENKEQINKQREIYRAFAHLTLFTDEYLKLIDMGHTQKQIDKILDEVENYKNNKKYTSLFLTAKKWLEKEQQLAAASNTGGRILKIANAFQDALQYG
jgi:DNA-binding transcriptional MocR family regulator